MKLMNVDDTVAKGCFQDHKAARMMHYASFNEALIAKPSWGLIEILTLDDDGMRRLHEEKELVLGPQGNKPPAFPHLFC
jgi:hypothetical protein